MAENDVVINIGAQDNASPTIGDIKREIAALTKELENTSAGTKEYADKLRRLGELKGELKDLREGIIALDPSQRAQLFASAFQSMTGAVQGLSGAMNLLGIENNKVLGIATAMQGAMNFAQGIQSVSELNQTFQLLKVTIASNPIFLISGVIAGIGVALFALKDRIQVIGDLFDAMMEKFKDVLDWLGIIDKEKDAAIAKDKERLSALDDEYKAIEKHYQRRIALEKAKGKDVAALEKELAEKKLKILDEQIKRQEALIKNGAEVDVKALQELKNKYDDLYNEILVAQATKEREQKELEKKMQEERRKQYEEYLANRLEATNKYYDKELKAIEKQIRFEIDMLNVQGAERAVIAAKEEELLNKKIELEKQRLQELSKIRSKAAKEEMERVKETLVELENQLKLHREKQKQDQLKESEERLKATIDAELAQFDAKKKAIDDEYNYRKQVIELTVSNEDEKQQRLLEIERIALEQKFALNSQYLSSLKALEKQGIEGVAEKKKAALEEEQKLLHQRELFNLRIHKAELERAKKEKEAKVQLALATTQQLASLSTNLFTIMENIGKKDKQSQLKLARAKFNIEKALRIAQATIDGYKGVTAQIAMGNLVGAAIAGALAAVQIAAIASTQFKEPSDSGDTGASATTPSISVGSSTEPSSAAQTQQFTPTFVSTSEGKLTTQPPQKNIAIIVENEIDDINKRLTYIQKQRNYN